MCMYTLSKSKQYPRPPTLQYPYSLYTGVYPLRGEVACIFCHHSSHTAKTPVMAVNNVMGVLCLQTEVYIHDLFSQDVWTNVCQSKLVSVSRCFPDHLEKEVSLFYRRQPFDNYLSIIVVVIVVVAF